MEKLIKSLYPVKYDGMCYIWSGNRSMKMLMDIHVRMRGWGWIQDLSSKLLKESSEEIQDKFGEFIAQAINEKIERDLLNKNK